MTKEMESVIREQLKKEIKDYIKEHGENGILNIEKHKLNSVYHGWVKELKCDNDILEIVYAEEDSVGYPIRDEDLEIFHSILYNPESYEESEVEEA